jgi:[glutamine synthetase] adenylyltransferase / [glutamine synthetase]-adenylyl-L-tyrosine phosphorylase
MPDLTRLEAELGERYPASWVRYHLDSFNPAYFEAFDTEEVSRHMTLLRALDDEHLVFARAWPADPEPGPGDDRWWVEVVGYDAFQFLATLCNLLAVRGLSIAEGSVFTSRPTSGTPPMGRRPTFRPGPGGRAGRTSDRGPDRRPKIVDRFLVRRARDQADAPAPLDWDAFQGELRSLAQLLREGRHDEVHHRLIGPLAAILGTRRGEEPTLEPLDLTIDPDADASATVVKVSARDSFGFLSLTASALALCGIRIVQAMIRTGDGKIDDTLWVTDRSGLKISSESQLRELRLSLILIEHFSSRLHRATNPKAALVHFSRFANDSMERPDWADEFAALDRLEVLDALVRVLGESDFLWEDYLQARPEDLLPMIANPSEWGRRSPAELSAELDSALVGATDRDGLARVLQRFKDREIFRAGFRAILGLGESAEALADELSDAAEVLLRAAYAIALRELTEAMLQRADGLPAPSALFVLGKCGGRELGFGSDLEVLLVHEGRPVGDPPVGPAFDRLVAGLRRMLGGLQGSMFELDFRLRPYGNAGAPAPSIATFADYYRGDGPAWSYERQALLKLRPIAGDPGLIAAVGAVRDRFVYGPEPFDLESCRRMRRLHVEQLVEPGRINAKFSPGALVDVEYFVQALQIAHGGRDPGLRVPNTLEAISLLGGAGRLDAATVEALRACYRFFRSLIDALRVVRGHARDLTVPLPETDEFVLLARRMRRPDPETLQAELQSRLGTTREIGSRLEDYLRVAPA